jgi:hypothetical protein
VQFAGAILYGTVFEARSGASRRLRLIQIRIDQPYAKFGAGIGAAMAEIQMPPIASAAGGLRYRTKLKIDDIVPNAPGIVSGILMLVFFGLAGLPYASNPRHPHPNPPRGPSRVHD